MRESELFRHAGVRRQFRPVHPQWSGLRDEEELPGAGNSPRAQSGRAGATRPPEIDLLGEVIAQDPGFQQTSVDIFPRGANGESPQKPVVERIQKDDTLLPSARNDGKLSLLDPIQDLS